MTYITRTTDHHYIFDGISYPGVTGILKVLDKSDALMGWAARMTAEAAVANIETLPTLLASVGPEGVVKALTSRSAWTNEKARDLGSEIHDLADRLVRGEPIETANENVAKRVALYAEWWGTSGWKLRASEAMLVNLAWCYGGTIDLLCYDADGRTVLADIKSGRIDYRGKVFDSIVLQLAAYGAGELIETRTGLYPMPEIDRYAVIHVTDDGVKVVDVAIGEQDRLAFRACIELTRWRQAMKGRTL